MKGLKLVYLALISFFTLMSFPAGAKAGEVYTFAGKWGITGSGDGQLLSPYGIAVDRSGNIYVADTGNNRIQKYDSKGTFITKWGKAGRGEGEFHSPYGVAVDSFGNV